MYENKEQDSFRGLDFDEEEILFSSWVRYHYEQEAMEDLEKLKSGGFEETPEEALKGWKRAEKYYRREQRLRILRRSYHLMQKVSVFLVMLFIGFTYLTVNVDAVNRAVVNWLTEEYPTHTHLSIELENSSLDFTRVKINWIPDGLSLDTSDGKQGIYYLNYQGEQIGSIDISSVTSNMTINTENAAISNLNLPQYDQVFLVERQDAKTIVASNSDVVITISVLSTDQYTIPTGHLIQILQNIETET